MLGSCTPIRLPKNQRPILLVVVDTEEEFDWSRFDRLATSIKAIRHIDRVQKIFDAYGIKPAYVVDYPIATQPDGIHALKEIQDSGRGVIGAHLHPWVNPPHEETVCALNSYPGNLPPELEAAKLRALTEAIAENFGRRPVIYKAGRYGVGPNTARILEENGYEVDASVAPAMDYRGQGGPDFSSYVAQPYWFGEKRQLLEIPLTGGFVGPLARLGRVTYRLAGRPVFSALRVLGILSRARLLNRLRLSPEGRAAGEHVKLTQALLKAGVRTFTWTFHSPSVAPGYTPYVRSQEALARFLDSFKQYFDYFLGELNGVTMTPLELKTYLNAECLECRM